MTTPTTRPDARAEHGSTAEPDTTEPRRTAAAGTPTGPGTTTEPRTTEPRSTADPDTTEPETPAARAARLVTGSRTFAAEAGIATRDTPSSVFRLLVLSCLLAAPVQHATALRAARALRPATRSAAALARTPVEEVSRHLTAAGYWRFHRTKAALLVRAAGDVVDRLDGDLRTLYREATSAAELHRALRRVPGVGTHAAHIVLREAQGVWPDLQPYLDTRVLDGAARLGLPTDPDALAALVDPEDLPRLAAGCVRATLAGGTRAA